MATFTDLYPEIAALASEECNFLLTVPLDLTLCECVRYWEGSMDDVTKATFFAAVAAVELNLEEQDKAAALFKCVIGNSQLFRSFAHLGFSKLFGRHPLSFAAAAASH